MSYGISEREMTIYLMFALYMIPTAVISSVLMINIQALLYGFNVFDYLKYCAYRFKHRRARWVGNDPMTDLSVKSVSRSTHDFCFSSQYYSLLLFCGMGLMLGFVSCETFIKHGYSPFSDILFFPILIFGFIVCHLTKLV